MDYKIYYHLIANSCNIYIVASKNHVLLKSRKTQ